MTGIDLARNMRTYQTAVGAQRLISALGGLGEIVTQRLGPCRPAAEADEGDVLLADNGQGRFGLAIRLPAQVAVAPGEKGLVWFCTDRSPVECCWRV
jgi:hypothetical protein